MSATPNVAEQASARLRLYVVEMLQRAEAMIPDLIPLDGADAIYTRISDDDEGLGLGVERQTDDSLSIAAQDGASIAPGSIFSDNDISASTLSKKPRPGFERLIAYVLAGQVTRVYAYSNSRLTRRPMELEVLIQLAEQRGLRIRTAVSGDDNLNTADGRMTARIKAAVDAAEAEKTGERVKRQKKQRLANGLPLGSRYRTFGYTAPAGGKQNPNGAGWEIIPEEAEIVKEVFSRVAGGESVNSVTKDLVERGVRRVSGEPWRYQATARMLESRIYAGRLSYKGEDAGPASVPALVPEALWAACQNRARKSAWNSRTGLLSGIAVCGKCSAPMNRDGQSYQCARLSGGCGSVGIKVEWLDAAVSGLVRLLEFRRGEEVSSAPDDDGAEKAAARVDEIDRKIAETQAAHTSGDLDSADAFPMLKSLRAERKAALKAAQTVVERDEQWQPLEDFDAADISLKRTIIKRHVTAVVVAPNPRPGNTKFDPSRFRILATNGTTYTGHDAVRLGANITGTWVLATDQDQGEFATSFLAENYKPEDPA